MKFGEWKCRFEMLDRVLSYFLYVFTPSYVSVSYTSTFRLLPVSERYEKRELSSCEMIPARSLRLSPLSLVGAVLCCRSLIQCSQAGVGYLISTSEPVPLFTTTKTTFFLILFTFTTPTHSRTSQDA